MKTNNEYLYNDYPIIFSPNLAEAIGLNEAIVIQKLHFWITKSKGFVDKNGNKWIYKTLEEWREDFPFWSIATIKRIFNILQNMRLVEIKKINKKDYDMTNYYRINYDELNKRCGFDTERWAQVAPIDELNLSSSNSSSCTDDNKESYKQHINYIPDTKVSGIYDEGKKSKAIEYIFDLYNIKRFKTKMQYQKIIELENKYGFERMKEIIDWANLNGFNVSKLCASIETPLKNYEKNKQKINKFKNKSGKTEAQDIIDMMKKELENGITNTNNKNDSDN